MMNTIYTLSKKPPQKNGFWQANTLYKICQLFLYKQRPQIDQSELELKLTRNQKDLNLIPKNPKHKATFAG